MRITKELKDLSPGELVKALRLRLELTQYQLGQSLGKHSSEIAAIETRSETIGLKRAAAFAKFFKVSRDRFLPKIEAK